VANESFTHGLSGEEIINDVLIQVEKALKRDCNLRPMDNYGQGYSGVIKIDLKLIALDVAEASVTANVKASPELLATLPAQTGEGGEGEESPIQTTEVKVDETVVIPQELNLDAVRERSEQNVPVDTLNPDGSAVVRGRSYKRVEAGVADPSAAPSGAPTTSGITGGAL
jgi:hypothetical protein